MSKKGQSKSGRCEVGVGAGGVELSTSRVGKTWEGGVRLGEEQRQAWPEASEGRGPSGQLRTRSSKWLHATWDSGCQAPTLQTVDPVIFRTVALRPCVAWAAAIPAARLRNSFLPKGSSSGHQAPEMLAFI